MAKSNKWSPMTALILAIAIVSLMNRVNSLEIQVLVNGTAYISCFPNKSLHIQWHHTPPDGSSTRVYAGGNFHGAYRGRFETKNDTKRYFLIIPNARSEDAGLYECEDEDTTGTTVKFGSTQLTVLDSNPVCTSNMNPDGFVGPNTCGLEQENMTFTCTVSFNGRPPQLTWRTSENSRTFNSSFCETKGSIRNCSLTLRSDRMFDGSTFVCQTAFPSVNRYNCSTEVITVQYFLADFRTAEKIVDESVNCSVTSNLNINYNWTLDQKTVLRSGSMILIERPGIYQCVVEYSIRNVPCLTTVVTVNVNNSVDDNAVTDVIGVPVKQNYVLAIALPIVIFSLVALVVVVFVVYKLIKVKKKKERFRAPVVDGALVPMIDLRQARFDKIRPRLAETCAILLIIMELVEKLKELQTINEEDFNEIDAEVDDNSKIEKLLSVIFARMNDAFDPFRETLKGINPVLGDFVEEGEIIAVDIETKMPGLDERLSEKFNEAVAKPDFYFKRYNFSVVVTKPSNSIEVYIYCRQVDDMKKFIEIFNSGELERDLIDFLNKLLLEIQPDNTGGLEASVKITQEQATIVEKFTEQPNWIKEKNKIRKPLSKSVSNDDSHIRNNLKSKEEEKIPLISKNEDGLPKSEKESKRSPSLSEHKTSSNLPSDDYLQTIVVSKKELATAITEENWNKIVRTNYADLLVKIDSSTSSGLEGEFRKLGLLTGLQIKSIWGHKTIAERNKKILDLLEIGDLERFSAFRKALLESGQKSVVDKHMTFIKEHLKTPDNRYNEPLKEIYRKKLQIHWNYLVEKIEFEDLIINLRERETLTEYQMRVLEDLPNEPAKTNYLLRLLETGSQQHFDDFCECLTDIGQSYIVKECL